MVVVLTEKYNNQIDDDLNLQLFGQQHDKYS